MSLKSFFTREKVEAGSPTEIKLPPKPTNGIVKLESPDFTRPKAGILRCKDCIKKQIELSSVKTSKEIGVRIYEEFSPLSNSWIYYKDGVCYMNEQVLMSIIRMVNPHQPDRPIKVLPREEFKNLKLGGNPCKEQ